MSTPASDNRQHAGDVVASASSALASGTASFDTLTALLARLFVEGLWRDFITPLGEARQYSDEQLYEFIEAKPLKGLGATYEIIFRYADQSTRDKLDELHEKIGREASVSDHAVDIVNSMINAPARPTGNSEAQALRRLRNDRPDIHERVMAGEMSAHAGMIEAGFRKRKISVPKDDPPLIANALRRHLSPEIRAEVARLLLEG
ncbi:hypothetical protein R8Z50_30350 [Longispora sp. K20-0274]|uniref:hypothetical protein n=1 Tax=Longispora sp. K20-0274 TaxID=3088255 RepID=UPI00399B55B7